ncbi:MAG: HAD-IIIA family hydrolase [Acidobacteriia bacterium]|nr:HAD-IIIA family hydrolase [Terriglobia bacterium]
MSKLPKRILIRLTKIKLLVFDVDGVLTPGDILVHPDGSESKSFDVRDGIAVRFAQLAGLRLGLLSGRYSDAVAQRAQDLGIEICVQGSAGKKSDFLGILEKLSLTPEEAAYVGDDIVDLPVLRIAGFAATVADACPEARESAHYVTKAHGGHGAVREIIEVVLKAQDRWNGVVQQFLEG